MISWNGRWGKVSQDLKLVLLQELLVSCEDVMEDVQASSSKTSGLGGSGDFVHFRKDFHDWNTGTAEENGQHFLAGQETLPESDWLLFIWVRQDTVLLLAGILQERKSFLLQCECPRDVALRYRKTCLASRDSIELAIAFVRPWEDEASITCRFFGGQAFRERWWAPHGWNRLLLSKFREELKTQEKTPLLFSRNVWPGVKVS